MREDADLVDHDAFLSSLPIVPEESSLDDYVRLVEEWLWHWFQAMHVNPHRCFRRLPHLWQTHRVMNPGSAEEEQQLLLGRRTHQVLVRRKGHGEAQRLLCLA